MEKLAENDHTYFYLRHVVIVVTAVTTISLTPVSIQHLAIWFTFEYFSRIEYLLYFRLKQNKP